MVLAFPSVHSQETIEFWEEFHCNPTKDGQQEKVLQWHPRATPLVKEKTSKMTSTITEDKLKCLLCVNQPTTEALTVYDE